MTSSHPMSPASIHVCSHQREWLLSVLQGPGRAQRLLFSRAASRRHQARREVTVVRRTHLTTASRSAPSSACYLLLRETEHHRGPGIAQGDAAAQAPAQGPAPPVLLCSPLHGTVGRHEDGGAKAGGPGASCVTVLTREHRPGRAVVALGSQVAVVLLQISWGVTATPAV